MAIWAISLMTVVALLDLMVTPWLAEARGDPDPYMDA